MKQLEHNVGLRSRKYNALAFFLGLVVCNDVIYVLKIGNTFHVNISIVYSLILLAAISILHSGELIVSFKIIEQWFYAFLLLVFFSAIPAFFMFASYPEYLSRFFNGIIQYALFIISLICTIMLRNQKLYVVKGLLIGFVLNIALSIIAYITYMRGNVFTLYDYFPQDSFNVPKYQFRAQGFFLEPSYLTSFIISTCFLLLSVYRMNTGKSLLMLLGLLITLSLSTSGNIVILISIGLLYWVLKNLRGAKTHNKKITLGFVFTLAAIIAFTIVFWNNIAEMDLIGNFIKGIQGADLSSSDNYRRIDNMAKTLQTILNYPIGVGWNMSHSILEITYDTDISVKAAFNFLLSNTLELGILGTVVYLVLIKKLSYDLFMRGKDLYQFGVGLSVLGMFACQVANGNRYYPFMFVIFGLAMIENYNNKQELINNTVSTDETTGDDDICLR